MGTTLALELLGEFDPNRQGEHFRRVERGNCVLQLGVVERPKTVNQTHPADIRTFMGRRQPTGLKAVF
jgi:hypothetical protein